MDSFHSFNSSSDSADSADSFDYTFDSQMPQLFYLTDDNESLPYCNVCSPQIPSQQYLSFNFVVIITLMPCIGFLGVIGNCLSAFVYSRPAMRSSINYYLCALAFSDIGVIITALFLFSVEGMRRYGPEIAEVFGAGAPYLFPAGLTAQTCSVYFTVAAGIDCFLIVVIPERYSKRWCTVKRAGRVSLVILILSIAYNVTHCFEIDIIDCWAPQWNSKSVQICMTEFRTDELYLTIYYMYMYTIVMAVGPLVLLIILNGAILITISWEKRKKRKREEHLKRHTDHSATDNGLPSGEADDEGSGDTITLILVVFLFIFCNSLALIINFLEQNFAENLGPTLNYLVDGSNLLVVCNSSANFIIYYTFGESFRKTLRGYLWWRPNPNRNRNIYRVNGNNENGAGSLLSPDTTNEQVTEPLCTPHQQEFGSAYRFGNDTYFRASIDTQL